MKLELKQRTYPVCPYCNQRLERIPEKEILCPNDSCNRQLSKSDFNKRR